MDYDSIFEALSEIVGDLYETKTELENLIKEIDDPMTKRQLGSARVDLEAAMSHIEKTGLI